MIFKRVSSISPWRPVTRTAQYWCRRTQVGCLLTVLAFNLGDACDVAGTKGVGRSGEEDEQDHAPEEGRHLEA